LPVHFSVPQVEGVRVDENESVEFAAFDHAVSAVQHDQDFVVIDTPPHDSYLMRLAHSMTDTLVTPLNDSFLDLDVLATLDPVIFAVTGVGHYAEMVCEARRHRRSVDGALSDWVVVRNRMSMFGSRNKRLVGASLNELGFRLGFRCGEGFAERLVYRELFPRGLTALDDLQEKTPPASPSPSHLAAREEVVKLLDRLGLPINERGRRRAAARAQWLASRHTPLDTGDILVVADR
jgi:chromosome partitioning protein